MITEVLQRQIRDMNPWWSNQPMPGQPVVRRHLVRQIDERLQANLAPIILVRGSRQVGKTTSCMQLIEHYLGNGVNPLNILRVQFDTLAEVISLNKGGNALFYIKEWYEENIIKTKLNLHQQQGNVVYWFLDELQNLQDWATQLKSLVDHNRLKVVVTGSSALRIQLGKDSLAGRITSLTVGVLSLTELGAIAQIGTVKPFLPDNGIEQFRTAAFWRALVAYGLENSSFRDAAFKAFAERGAYPLAHIQKLLPWSMLAPQLNENIIERVINHDLRVGDKGRKRDPILLKTLFGLLARYAGQTPTNQKLANEIAERYSPTTVQKVVSYRSFLDESLLIRSTEPLELRNKKQKSPVKICLADPILRRSWLQETIDLDPHNADPVNSTLAGHLAESIVGSMLFSIPGLELSYLPARHDLPEIDFVMTIGLQRVPIEVKYTQHVKGDHLAGLSRFLDKTNEPLGLIITRREAEIKDTRIIAVPLSTLLLMR